MMLCFLCGRLLQRFQPLFMMPGIMDKPKHRGRRQHYCQHRKPQLQKINFPIGGILQKGRNKHQRAGDGNFLLLPDGNDQLKSYAEVMAEKYGCQKPQQNADNAALFHSASHILVSKKAQDRHCHANQYSRMAACVNADPGSGANE